MYYDKYDPIGYSNVKIVTYPIDCEFFTAPIGNKGGYYEPVVNEVTQKSKSQRDGKWFPIVTYDHGKTWQWDDPDHPTTPLVNVIWQRKEDARS